MAGMTQHEKDQAWGHGFKSGVHGKPLSACPFSEHRNHSASAAWAAEYREHWTEGHKKGVIAAPFAHIPEKPERSGQYIGELEDE